MEKERTLKQIVISVMRKRQGYTSDFGGFYFLAEDYFATTASEIVAELKEALKEQSASKRGPAPKTLDS